MSHASQWKCKDCTHLPFHLVRLVTVLYLFHNTVCSWNNICTIFFIKTGFCILVNTFRIYIMDVLNVLYV